MHAFLPSGCGDDSLTAESFPRGPEKRGTDIVDKNLHVVSACTLAHFAQKQPLRLRVGPRERRILGLAFLFKKEISELPPIYSSNTQFPDVLKMAVITGQHYRAAALPGGKFELSERCSATPSPNVRIGKLLFPHQHAKSPEGEFPVGPCRNVAD